MGGTVEEFYTNDIVYRFDKRKRIVFGVVTESYETSSDVDDFNNLEKGQIRVWWSMSSREQVWKQNKVRLLNRTIVAGDIVRRFVQGQDTQRGYCKYAKQLVTVQIVGTDKIIERVCSTRLKPVSKFLLTKTVCFDNKFGRIQNIECKILMHSKCGSCVELSRFNTSEAILDDYWLSKRNRWYSGAYYPGQEVVCIPQYLRGANWLHRSKNMKRRMQSRMRFTIQKVEIEAVNIIWFPLVDSGENKNFDQSTVKGEDIKRLKILDNVETQYFELAERIFLKLSSTDNIIKKQDWLRKQAAHYKPDVHKVNSRYSVNRSRFRSASIQQVLQPNPPTVSDEEDWWTDEAEAGSEHESTSSLASPRAKSKRHWPPRPKEIVPGNTLAVEVLSYESKITVVWQDGTVEEDIPSTQLYYSVSVDDHEFFPGEWVVAESNQNFDEYGAVQSVNHLERTAKVKWFRMYDKNGSKPEPMCLHTSELSVYDLQKHRQYQFRPGGIVFRAIKSTPDTPLVVGHVHDSYPEGYVHVHWMDDTETRSWPQDLFLLPDVEYDLLSDASTDYQPGSWETESIESVDSENAFAETKLALMASKLDYIRNKMVHLKDMFKQHRIPDNFTHLRDLLIMYDNSSYLDKLLGTSFFTRKSRHFRMLLDQVKKRAQEIGIELSGILFTTKSHQNVKIENAEEENIETVRNIETALNAQISQSQSAESIVSPDCDHEPSFSDANLCVEFVSMLKARMDLAYAEIVSRIGDQEALMVMTKASENTPAPSTANTPEETLPHIIKPVKQIITGEGYAILDEAPKSHHFYTNKITPTNTTIFYKAIRREIKLLEESLPPGVWVRGYSDRIDLLSIMIRGPSNTPYEDGLFLFDLQLGADYPLSPPSVHYISFSSERLNPNLYVEGKVCVSLLGTWIGKGSEVWGPCSSLLQLIVSIQGLILVSEPYYNEAGYEKQVESQQGYENSRTYNELVILKLVQAMTVLLISPPDVFKREIVSHFTKNGKNFCERIEKWTAKDEPCCPDFPLLPVSKGFLLSLQYSLTAFKDISTNIIDNYNMKLQKGEENV